MLIFELSIVSSRDEYKGTGQQISSGQHVMDISLVNHTQLDRLTASAAYLRLIQDIKRRAVHLIITVLGQEVLHCITYGR